MQFTLHRFAKFTAAATFLLICAGGLVTTTESGLSVPDWPLSFGKVFPPMVGGVRFEHSHRLIAAFVAALTAVLALWCARREPRRWVRRLAWTALGAVLAQAVLGGLTVIYLLPHGISLAHAALAEIFFALVVTLAVVTSPGWRTQPPTTSIRPLAGMAALMATVVYVQILLGAAVRHYDAGLAIPDFPLVFGGLLPPAWSFPVGVHFAHRAGALAVAALVAMAAWRAHASAAPASLRRGARLAAALVLVQIVLGAFTIWSGRAVAPTTAHVAGGALLFATSVVMALRAQRWARAER